MQKGHVVFINPPSQRPMYRGVVCTWVSKAIYLWQPFDFILLSALVPAQARVSYLDSYVHGKTMDDMLEFIEKEGATQLVLSMSSIEWDNDKTSLSRIRERFPNMRIAVFGDVFQERFFAEQALALDVTIIRHPLDLKIKEYFKSGKAATSSLLQRFPDGGRHLPPVDLLRSVDFPVPRHEVFMSKRHRSPFDKYFRSSIVNITWACPYACSYCSWSSPYLPFAYRTAHSVIKELETLKKLKVREIFFGDLSFGYPSDIVGKVLDVMIERDWRFSWHCYIKAGSVSDELLKKMRRAGCHTVITGVESSDLDLARFNRNVSLQEIRHAVDYCHELGMDICGDFILGLNGTSDNWKELARFAIDLDLDFASFNVYTPLFGSMERYKKIEEGAIKEGEWGYDTTGHKKSLIEHSENRNKCVKTFYGRPSYWMRRLSRVRTLDEVLIKAEEAVHLFLRKEKHAH